MNLVMALAQVILMMYGYLMKTIFGVLDPGGTIVHFDGIEWKKIEFDKQWYTQTEMVFGN